MAISEAWERIELWLSRNAPKIHKSLNPGASPSEVARIERIVGVPMPQEWRDLYRLHDGINPKGNGGNLFYAMGFFSLDRVQRSLATNDPLAKPVPLESADAGIRTEDAYDSLWIPLGSDFGDTTLNVDMHPKYDDTGMLGQIIFVDPPFDTAIRVAGSLSELLWQFAHDLEDGRYFLNKEALEDGDEFLACDRELDITNWIRSPRWKHLDRTPTK